MPYKAFISYSHHADSLFAPALQSALHHFAKPFYRLRALQVFRDQSDLATNPALWPAIERALRQSEYFLLLASPGAAASHWVEREVETWLELHQGAVDKLLIAWTDGELAWDEAAADFDWQRTTALPARESLRGKFREEPLYLDLRWVRTATDLSLRNPRFLNDIATLAATLHGRPKSEMIGEDVQQHKRYRRVRAAVITLLSLLALLASGFGIVAERQRRIAVERLAIADSRRLAIQGETLRRDQPDLALLLSLEAHRIADTLEARGSLMDGVEGSGRLLTTLRGHSVPAPAPSNVFGLAFSPDGKILASGGMDRTIRFWDTRTWQPLGPPLTGHDGEVNQIAFSPDGRLLASAGEDETVRFWDVATRRPLGPPLQPAVGPGGPVPVKSLSFSPDGKILAVATPYATTQLWDVAGRRPLGPVGAGILGNRADRIAFSPDGRTFVTCSAANDPMQLWETATRKLLGAFPNQPSEAIRAAFSPDGKLLVTGGQDNAVRLWDVATRQPAGPPLPGMSPEGHDVFAVAFSPDGRTIAAAGDDGLVRLWDARTRKLVGKPLSGHAFTVYSLAFRPDRPLLATGGQDGTVRLWNLRSEQPLASRIDEGGTSPEDENGIPILLAALSPDGRRLATSDEEGRILLWDLPSGHRNGPSFSAPARALSFDATGRRLEAADETGTVWIWDTATGRLAKRFALGLKEIHLLLFTPDGSRLVAVQPDGASRVWDLAAGKLVSQAPGSLKMGAYLATASRDAGMLALASIQGPVQVWDMAAGRHHDLDLGSRGSLHLAASLDGRWIAAGNLDGTIDLADTAIHKALGRIQASTLVGAESHNGTIKTAFSPDGRILASAGAQSLRLWDVRTRQLLGELLGPRPVEAVQNLAFSLDGKALVAGGVTEEVTVWDLDPASWRRRACRIVNRNLTRGEWEQYLPGEPYRKTCPGLP